MTEEVNTPSAGSGRDDPQARLRALGITLPAAPRPVANFVTHVREGPLLFLSGQGPREPDGRIHAGKVGREVSVEEAYRHARLVEIGRAHV